MKYYAFVFEASTAGGGTVEIINGFSQRVIDPQATNKTVDVLITRTPQWESLQSQRMKIESQRKIAKEKHGLMVHAANTGDEKNERLYSADLNAAFSAICVLEDEARPLIVELETVRRNLYMEYAEFFPCGPGQHCLENDEYEALKAKFDALEGKQRLTRAGEVIPDNRGLEYYHKKKSGKWVRGKIEHIGETPPEGFITIDALPSKEQQEIAGQQEMERIAAMSVEERAQAKVDALNALADEAGRFEQRAKIQGKTFDPIAHYDKHKAAIEAKYA